MSRQFNDVWEWPGEETRPGDGQRPPIRANDCLEVLVECKSASCRQEYPGLSRMELKRIHVLQTASPLAEAKASGRADAEAEHLGPDNGRPVWQELCGSTRRDRGRSAAADRVEQIHC